MKSLGMAKKKHQIQSMPVEKLEGMPWFLARQPDGSLQSVKCAWKKKKKEGKKTFPTHTSTTAATHPLGYGAGKAALCHLLRHTLPLGVSQDDCFWGLHN